MLLYSCKQPAAALSFWRMFIPHVPSHDGVVRLNYRALASFYLFAAMCCRGETRFGGFGGIVGCVQPLCIDFIFEDFSELHRNTNQTHHTHQRSHAARVILQDIVPA